MESMLMENTQAERYKDLLEKKDQQLRSVAHDLRNPIGGILSTVELLIDDGSLAADQSELLLLIKDAASHSLSLVQELLMQEVADPCQDRQGAVDLHAVIAKCVQLLKRKLLLKKQTLTLEFYQEKQWLTINQENITRVINNLTANAIKFTPPGGKISISTNLLRGGVQLTVTDNGIGIPEEFQSGIFDGVQESRRHGTLGEQSHGLGLTICKQIIMDYRGTLTFESNPHKGSKFFVWLPL